MKKFALITEGVTDYLVIKELLFSFFKGFEIKVNQIQPSIDETDKQTGFGNWENVIKYCQNDDLNEIALYNDFIIIQIDTDIAENSPINISLQNKSNEQVCIEMEERLKGIISNQESDFMNLLFAIGVHSMECWLVGIIDDSHNKSNVNNCIDRLNRAIGKTKKYKIIPPDKKGNSKETYTQLASKLRKIKDIIRISKKNAGFDRFISQLQNINF